MFVGGEHALFARSEFFVGGEHDLFARILFVRSFWQGGVAHFVCVINDLFP